MELEGME